MRVELEKTEIAQRSHFLASFEAILLQYEAQLGEKLTIFRTGVYRDTLSNRGVTFTAEAKSDNVPIYKIGWSPLEKTLYWTLVLVLEKGRGTGTRLRQMTEELGINMEAEKIVCQYIYRRHLEYWQKIGYQVDFDRQEAIRFLV